MIKVVFPQEDNIINHLVSALEIIRCIETKAKRKDEIVLDFSEVPWFIPCSMILISNKITELSDRNMKIKTIPPEKDSVKEHMKKIGFPFGTNEKGGSFVPLKHFKKKKGDGNQVQREVNKLMNEIEGKIPSKFEGSVKYILGELSDNIDNHSEFTYASLMAQYFPNKKYVDVAVFDNGVTIPGLFERHKISFKNDEESIRKAVEEGKTTKKEEPARGYGLKSCKELSITGMKGEFFVISRKGIFSVKFGQKPILYALKNSLKGTFLYLRLYTPEKSFNLYDHVE